MSDKKPELTCIGMKPVALDAGAALGDLSQSFFLSSASRYTAVTFTIWRCSGFIGNGMIVTD
jgi:hypothetical protein